MAVMAVGLAVAAGLICKLNLTPKLGVDTLLLDEATKVTGVILAGGKSSRMGTDKAMLKIGCCTTIERISAVLRAVTSEILIVTGQPEKHASFGDRSTPDLLPNNGPLGGIHAGLVKSHHQLALMTACDLPFISAPLCRLLINSMTPDLDAVVPRFKGRLEPLCAVYSKSALKVIEERLALGLNKTVLLFDELQVRYLDDAEMAGVEMRLDKAFLNLNTPADFKIAQAWSAQDDHINS